MYGDRLKMLFRSPQSSSQITMDKGDGIFGYDEPLQVLAKLAGSSDYGSLTDSSPLHLFREAWDKVSFVKMIIRDLDLRDRPEFPMDHEKKWRGEAGEEVFRENIDWWGTFAEGMAWKDWCNGFHGEHRESRGVLLLLMVVLKSCFTLVSGQKLDPCGGDLNEFQIEWISVYVKKEQPELLRLAEFLSPWAVELYRRGYLCLDYLEVFDSGLDALLESL